MTRIRSLVVFQILVVGGGLAIGYLTSPDGWYANLTKPTFTPPGWLFAPVWTLLYISIAITGWRISGWRPKVTSRTAIRLWWAQLVLNFLWSPLFFGLHLTSVALVVIVLLLITILFLIVVTWSKDPIVALLTLPYALWVAFASVLNGSIVALN
jgi:benzodiazapine receptor